MSGILLVDDEEGIRNLLNAFLEGKGYKVYSAANGEQAMTLFTEHHPDMVITDIFMPEKDGLEVVAEVRRQDSRVPLIVISGGGRMRLGDILQVARQMGATQVVSKPVSLGELLGIVQRYLPASPPVPASA